jgi:methyl-accepting chemotaxis protein
MKENIKMKWFNNLKIGTKLISSFILVSLITAFLGYLAISNFKTLRNRDTILYEKNTIALAMLGKISNNFQKMRVFSREVLLAKNAGEYEGYCGNINKCNEDMMEVLKNYEKSLSDKEDEARFRLFQQSFINYYKGVEEMMKIISSGRNSDAEVYMRENMASTVKNLDDLIQKGIDGNQVLAESTHAKNTEIADSIINFMLIIMFGAVIVSISFGIYLTRIIKKPIQELMHLSDKIANGELNVQINVETKDEIGHLGQSFSKMKTSLVDMINDILKSMNTINNSAENLLKLSEKSTRSSNELLSQANNTSSASEQISANVNTVATSAEEMTSSIKEISKNTNEAAKIAKVSQESALVANEVMKNLGTSSMEIGNIVKTITSIAEQTNLLALNATIEAARAGESGKGFAVVANEVKDLAKESAKATEDITSRIKTIQTESSNAVNSISDIIQNIKLINDVTNTIASSVEEQTVTTAEVNRNLSEASKGVGTIVAGNTGMLNSVNDASKIAKDLKAAAENLSMLSKEFEKKIESTYRLN